MLLNIIFRNTSSKVAHIDFRVPSIVPIYYLTETKILQVRHLKSSHMKYNIRNNHINMTIYVSRLRPLHTINQYESSIMGRMKTTY